MDVGFSGSNPQGAGTGGANSLQDAEITDKSGSSVFSNADTNSPTNTKGNNLDAGSTSTELLALEPTTAERLLGDIDNSANSPDEAMGVLDHVGDGFAQFGKGVWGTVEGLGSLAVGVGKTVYDSNRIGQTVDFAERVTGTDLPDWLPSADRGQQRIHNAAQSLVDLGKAVWDDPSILISEYTQLAEDGRYGAIVGQAVADFGDLLIGTKGAGKAARVANAADLVADAGKLSRAADSATDLAKLAAANPEFAAKSTNALEKTRAVLETVDDSALSVVARSNLDASKALIDDVLEISAPRDANIGNPAAIANGFGELSTRQSRMLDSLPKDGSKIVQHKSDVTMIDIAALTAKTGDEFAIFTRGSQRMVMRGDSETVPVNLKTAARMSDEGLALVGSYSTGVRSQAHYCICRRSGNLRGIWPRTQPDHE